MLWCIGIYWNISLHFPEINFKSTISRLHSNPMLSVLVAAELFLRVAVTLHIPSCDSRITYLSAVQPALGSP